MTNDKDPLRLSGTLVGGKYLVGHAIGEGGSAIVYRAEHQGWNLPVAIKFLVLLSRLPEGDRAKAFDEFLKEGRLVSELSTKSSAIVQPRDIGVLERPGHPPLPYLVLEWLDGKSLDEVIVAETNSGKPPRDLQTTMRLLEPVAGALSMAHASNVAHRDVKPENLLLLAGPDGTDTVKLLDFGIAKVMQRRQDGVHQTGTAPTAFTPHYGAPEQFSRTYGETGPWTDVFSMALVLLEVLRGGRRAFQGDAYADLGQQSCDESRRPTPRALGLQVSDDVEAVFRRALAVRPEYRYPSMKEFWTAFASAVRPEAAAWTASAAQIAAASAGYVTNREPPAPSAPVPTPVNPTATTDAAPVKKGGSRTIVIAAAAVGALLIGGAAIGAAKRLFPGASATASTPSASVAPDASGPTSSAVPASSTSAAAPGVLCPGSGVVVPGGRFTMGSTASTSKDDDPEHVVFIDTFCLDKTEVTAGEFAKCIEAGGCTPPPLDAVRGDRAKCTLQDAALTKQPMNCVSHGEAVAYCTHLAMRLPTEAEWELAATKDAALDLVGHVAEWTSDYFGPYQDGQQLNPRGPPTGTKRVVRGGETPFDGAPKPATSLGPDGARMRVSVDPASRAPAVGFRCAAELKR